MDISSATHDSNEIGPDALGGTYGSGSDRSRVASKRRESGWSRERRVLVIVASLLLIGPGIAAWRWFRWTRTDAYQFQRVDAEATALIHGFQGWDGTDRWIALTALARDPAEASIRASEISNPFYRIQTLSLLTATLAKAGAESDAEAAGRQLSEVARVLEDSTSSAQDPDQSIRLLEAIAIAMTRAGLAVPARAVAIRARDKALQITDALVRSRILASLCRKLAERGQFDLAQEGVIRIEDPVTRTGELTELASILARSNRFEEARAVALRAIEAAARIPNTDSRAAARFDIAPVLARIGLADQARDTSLLLENPSSRWSSLHSVATVFLEQGHAALARDAALRIRKGVSELPTPVGRWDMLQSVTEILVKSGSLDIAKETALEAHELVMEINGPPADMVNYLGGAPGCSRKSARPYRPVRRFKWLARSLERSMIRKPNPRRGSA